MKLENLTFNEACDLLDNGVARRIRRRTWTHRHSMGLDCNGNYVMFFDDSQNTETSIDRHDRLATNWFASELSEDNKVLKETTLEILTLCIAKDKDSGKIGFWDSTNNVFISIDEIEKFFGGN